MATLDNRPEFDLDLREFMRIATTDSYEDRLRALKGNEEDAALCEIARYGIFNDSAMVGPLGRLYRNMVLNLPYDRRLRLLSNIRYLVEYVRSVSVNALLPFIVEEHEQHIVGTAVLDFVLAGTLRHGDPMTRPKEVILLIESGVVENTGAAFGGLLHLGDRRVCDLLRPLRDRLTSAEARVVVTSTSGFVHSTVVEFEIEWLESMNGDVDDHRFDIVASGLAQQKLKNELDVVFTGGIRSLPSPSPGLPGHPEVSGPIPVDEYARRIAPRLHALESVEPPPRMMSYVLETWNLAPRAALDRRDPEIRVSKEDWFGGKGRILLTMGILNPHGPTVYCLGERWVGEERLLFFRWLHLFGGETYDLTTDQREPLTHDAIERGVSMILRYCYQRGEPQLVTIPSFVIPAVGDEAIGRIARRLIVRHLSDEDWGREMACLRTFGSDYFARADWQLHGHEWPAEYSSRFTSELFNEWWDIVTASEHTQPALEQLHVMWQGAISLLNDRAATTVPFDWVDEFLRNYGFSPPD